MKKYITIGILAVSLSFGSVQAQEVSLTAESRAVLVAEIQAKIQELLLQLLTTLQTELSSQKTLVEEVQQENDQDSIYCNELSDEIIEEKEIYIQMSADYQKSIDDARKNPDGMFGGALKQEISRMAKEYNPKSNQQSDLINILTTKYNMKCL